MAISDQQNQDLQNQYQTLRAQGMSHDDATTSIGNTLKSTVVGDTGETAFTNLKNSYNNGGLSSDWTNGNTNINNGATAPAIPTPNQAPTTQPTTKTPAITATTYTTGYVAPNTIPVTNMSGEKVALNQNSAEGAQKVADAQKSFILNQSTYQQNKGYYSNFDQINNSFNSIMGEREKALQSSPDGTITDKQAQDIATRYNVSPDSVKNPNLIFKGLTPTEEGAKQLGVTAHQTSMDAMKTEHERTVNDASTALNNTSQTMQTSLDDAQKQLERNISFATASGAWNGESKSSSYLAGIDNMRQDGQATINKLQALLESTKQTSSVNSARVASDYTTAVQKANDDFNKQYDDLKMKTGLALNTDSATYGIGSEELSKAIDKINADYGANAADISAKYIANLKAINDLTQSNIATQQKAHDYITGITNERYNQYIDKTNPILGSSSYNTIASDVTSGKITYDQGQNLKLIMQQSVNAALTKFGTVNTSDIHTINDMLDQGKTPAEVVAKMQEMDKFSTGEDAAKTITVKNNDQSESVFQWNRDTGRYDIPVNTPTNTNPTTSTTTLPDTKSIIDFVKNDRNGAINLQCGELVNSYWKQITGSRAGLGDSIESKINAVNSLGSSKIPVAGGIFVLSVPGSSTGHTGIVQSVNSDGSIDVLESNRINSPTGTPPQVGHYSAEQAKGMLFSVNPQSQGVTEGTSGNIPDRNKNPGDLKMGNVGYGVDSQGHTIFGSAEQGYNALIKDLTDKQSGNTTTGLNGSSTIEDLSKKYATDNTTWLSNVMKDSGYSKDTQLKDVDIPTLAKAVGVAEGFTGKFNSVQSIGQGKTYTQEQQDLIDELAKHPSITPTDLKGLREANLQETDVTSAKARNSKDMGGFISSPDKPSSAIANVINNVTGVSYGATYKDAIMNAVTGKPANGSRGSTGQNAEENRSASTKAAAICTAAGVDQAQLTQEYTANQKSLSQIIPRITSIAAYTEQAQKNADLVRSLADSAKVGGSPLVNKYTQWASKEWTGNTPVSKLETAIYGFAREYAKVVSGSTASSAAITDTASAKADSLINASMNPETLKGVIDIMTTEMDNTKTTQKDALDQATRGVAPNLNKFYSYILGEPVSSDQTTTNNNSTNSGSNGTSTKDVIANLLAEKRKNSK